MTVTLTPRCTAEKRKEEDKRLMDEYEKDLQEWKDIKAAKEKMIEFNSLVLGVFAVHPELDFENWPAPRGKNPYKPSKNVLHETFLEHLEDGKDLLEYWKRLANRLMIHKCKKGSCLTETFKTVKDPEGKKQKVKESHCRFKFPFELNGFKNQFNKETGELEGIVPNPSVKDDPLFDPLTYGASYRRLDEKTQTV